MVFTCSGATIGLLLTMAQMMCILLPVGNSVGFSVHIETVCLVKFYASSMNELGSEEPSMFGPI